METIIKILLEQLALRLRAERKMLKLSQEELAEEAGVPLRTYKRFEAAECDSLEVLIKVAASLERRTGSGRLILFDKMFPGGVREAAPSTPLGALWKLEKTRVAVSKRKKKREGVPDT